MALIAHCVEQKSSTWGKKRDEQRAQRDYFPSPRMSPKNASDVFPTRNSIGTAFPRDDSLFYVRMYNFSMHIHHQTSHIL